VTKLQPNCDDAKLDKMQIYMSTNSADLGPDDLVNNCELIPYEKWNGSLKELGLREGNVLIFTSKDFRKAASGSVRREPSHVRSSGGNTANIGQKYGGQLSSPPI
jgi:hypothetical protein